MGERLSGSRGPLREAGGSQRRPCPPCRRLRVAGQRCRQSSSRSLRARGTPRSTGPHDAPARGRPGCGRPSWEVWAQCGSVAPEVSSAGRRCATIARMAGPTDHEQTPEGQIAALERAVSTLRAAGLPVDAVLERIASLREQISAAPAPGQVASVTEAAPAPGSTTIVQNIENHTGGNTFGHVHGHVTIGDDRSARDAAALHAYRRWVAAGCERLAMRLLAPEQNDASRSDETPELARVYVDLDTSTTEEGTEDGKPVRVRKGLEARLGGSREEAPRRLSVLDVMAKEPRLVLLGQPGFGKSTLVQHTALCLACDAAAPEVGWDKLVSGLGCRGADMLPVVVLLRDLAASLPESSKGVEQRPARSGKSAATLQRGKPGEAERSPAASGEVLRSFLESRIRDAGLVDSIEPFWKALSEGKALVLLDGLDEVPTPEARQFLRDVVNAFERLYPSCRYLVTCRVLTWEQEKLSLRGFAVTEIAPFDDAKIQRFIGAWHAELVRLGRMDAATAGRLGPKLLDAIRERPGLAVLAQTPLLLTVMAVVHTKGGQLPEGEALLYREAVEVLLWRWQDTVSAQSPKKVLDEVGARDGDLLDALRRLAFTVHGRTPAGDRATDDGAGGVADIAETDLLEALMTLDPGESRQWARRLVDALKARAGLLLERAPQTLHVPAPDVPGASGRLAPVVAGRLRGTGSQLVAGGRDTVAKGRVAGDRAAGGGAAAERIEGVAGRAVPAGGRGHGRGVAGGVVGGRGAGGGGRAASGGPARGSRGARTGPSVRAGGRGQAGAARARGGGASTGAVGGSTVPGRCVEAACGGDGRVRADPGGAVLDGERQGGGQGGLRRRASAP